MHGTRDRQRSSARRSRGDSQPSEGMLYLYGFVLPLDPPEADAELLASLRGIEPGVPVELMVRGDVGALVSRVPASRYGKRALSRSVKDLGWVVEHARRHHQVLTDALQHFSVAPCRLATVLCDQDSLLALLDTRRQALGDMLARLRGSTEWAIKVDLVTPTSPPPSRPGAGVGAGAAYLLGRVQEASDRRQARERAERQAEAVLSAVATRSIEVLALPLHDPGRDSDREAVLNLTCLVHREQGPLLQDLLTRLSAEAEGVLLSWSGSLPAYSFTGELMGTGN